LVHTNLGLALSAQGKTDQAIEEYRQAIRLQPDDAKAHSNLGNALSAQGKTDQAIEEYRQAIRLQPDLAEAHCNLGLALKKHGLFRESLESLERGHQLGSRQPGWKSPSAQWVLEARRLVQLEATLPSILRGETRPSDAVHRLELADLCSNKGLPAASARLWDEAFSERPELADDLARFHRFNAACAAALAGTGSGKDDPPPDEAARLGFRDKARVWLRADLAAWARVLDGADEPARKKVAPTLAHWKADPDLAGIRDEPVLAKLPEAEREAFRSLWAEVEALSQKVEDARR
jgi:tetratricopeptide (TPR) repeat protein